MPSPTTQGYIGRQAIYDSANTVFAYELISSSRDAEAGSNALEVLNTFLENGFENISGPHPVFIQITPAFVIDMSPLPFDPLQVVAMLSAQTPLDEATHQSLQLLADQGFSMALDGYCFETQWQPLLAKFKFVRIDAAFLFAQNQTAAEPPAALSANIIATGIDSDEQLQQCRERNVDFFQGSHFARPTMVTTRRFAENELTILQLMANLNDPEVSINSLEQLIQQDPVLSYKILRYINSAAIGMRRKIESIKQAVVLLGLKRIRAWATVLAMSSMPSGNQDLLINGIVRAFMCQSLVRQAGGNADTAFTVGTLSILDELLQTPLDNVLNNLPLADEISHALLSHEGRLGQALACAIAYEKLDWDSAAFPGCSSDDLNEIYLNSSHEGFRAVMGMEV